MIRTIAEFVEGTVFELSAINTLLDTVETLEDRALDLRGVHPLTAVVINDQSGLGSLDRVINNLRPLLFGAAWKVLDLAVEVGLHEHGADVSDLSIKRKCRDAATAAVRPFDRDRSLWTVIAAVYSGLEQARHCLVHRDFELASTGDMTKLRSKSNAPVRELTTSEQVAFCRLARRTASVIRLGYLDPRDRMDLVASCDSLVAHHCGPRLGGGAIVTRPPRVLVNASRVADEWIVDIDRARSATTSTWIDVPYCDLEVFFPNTAFSSFHGRLEEAPSGATVVVRPSEAPDWLCY